MISFLPKDIKDSLDKVVVGQESAKKMLSILTYNHFVRMQCDSEPLLKEYQKPPKLNGLLIGPTGTGKTLLIDTLGEYTGLPVLKIPATRVGHASHDRLTLTDYCRNFVNSNRYNDNWTRTRYGIVYIDEFDKLWNKGDGEKDNYYKAVAEEFLTFLHGEELNISATETFSTHNLFFILSGTFEDVVAATGLKKEIGFHADQSKPTSVEITKELLQAHSTMNTEVLGRVHVIDQTYKLSRDEIHDILFVNKGNVAEQFSTLFLPNNEPLLFSTEEVEGIIDKVEGSDYGLREAYSIVFKHLKSQLFDVGTKDEK